MEVFVVVCHDRHTDDEITVHLSLESANAAVSAFKAAYGSDIQQWYERDYGAPKWVRYVDCHEEGPSARIERTTIQGG